MLFTGNLLNVLTVSQVMVSIPVALGVGLILILLLIYCWSRNKKWVRGWVWPHPGISSCWSGHGSFVWCCFSWCTELRMILIVVFFCVCMYGFVYESVWSLWLREGLYMRRVFLMCICLWEIWTILRWPLCGWQDVKILPWLFLSFVTVVSWQGGSWEAYKQCLGKIFLWSLCHAEGPVWNVTLKVLFETAQL